MTAACMAIRADVFRMMGGFDEAMPLAYNDIDLCLRLRAAGWRIIWTPAAELLHQGSASLGRHDIGAHAERYTLDVALMRQRWGAVLDADPFYNRQPIAETRIQACVSSGSSGFGQFVSAGRRNSFGIERNR